MDKALPTRRGMSIGQSTAIITEHCESHRNPIIRRHFLKIKDLQVLRETFLPLFLLCKIHWGVTRDFQGPVQKTNWRKALEDIYSCLKLVHSIQLNCVILAICIGHSFIIISKRLRLVSWVMRYEFSQCQSLLGPFQRRLLGRKMISRRWQSIPETCMICWDRFKVVGTREESLAMTVVQQLFSYVFNAALLKTRSLQFVQVRPFEWKVVSFSVVNKIFTLSTSKYWV